MAFSAKHRRNLLKLAAYLENLPRNYKHFAMANFAAHRGDCGLPDSPHVMAAKDPDTFLRNCGAVACAVGHGPAAGIPLKRDELFGTWLRPIKWQEYAARTLAADKLLDEDELGNCDVFDFLFAGEWEDVDNHHYGAAARIRYLIDGGKGGFARPSLVNAYAPYRKGSRSAKRREIESALAEQVPA